ncbi:hypothetical protein Areg01_65740 [Actinoplanes regularis]|nr:hypothetical protein Areg01_65740 [Actinoplanes regularis]
MTAASTAAALTLALTGCSAADGAGASAPADSTETESSTPPDLVAKWTAYADCLKGQGVDAKYDPSDGVKLPENLDAAKQDAAEAACRSVAPAGVNAKPDAEQLDQSVKMARCLRGKGVNIKDPTAANPEPRIEDPKPADLQQIMDDCTKVVGPGRGGSRK